MKNMTQNIIKQKASFKYFNSILPIQTTKKNIYFVTNKTIKTFFNHNYVEPETEDEIEEVKRWLKLSKHKYLSVYFTNNWNPVAKRASNEYPKFTKKTSQFINLRIDTDKYPRLKWFFDGRCDPGLQFYLYGTRISQLGGTNFEKALLEMKRIQEYSEKEFSVLNREEIDYEMPYYDYERDLPNSGNPESIDGAQCYGNNPWMIQLLNLKQAPFEENFIARRLKK
jgi:hypothetical protein